MRSDIQTIKQLLAELNHRPNKALGQNFFIDGPRLARLAAAMDINGRHVLEIGAGLGALTELLLPHAAALYAVEKDRALCDILTRWQDPKLHVICGDCLTQDYSFLPPDFVAVGNLPYYITTPVCEMLLCLQPREMTLMVQKEAGARFFAGPGEKNYGPVAILSQLYYDIRLLDELPESCYWPQPGVRSCVVQLRRNSEFGIRSSEVLSFIKTCLHMRRKTLANNLKGVAGIEAALQEMQLPLAIRGEALTPEQFAELYKWIFYSGI